MTHESASSHEIEFDHLFIMVDEAGSVADCLIQFGLSEGSPNTHPGQGTSCRRFFFENGMIELLWIDNLVEAESPTIERTRLADRWRRRNEVAPFGYCTRPAKADAKVPYPAWEYQPPYLPDPLSIQMSVDDSLDEPLCFHLGFLKPLGRRNEEQPTVHPSGQNRITQIEFQLPHLQQPSKTLRTLASLELFRLKEGDLNMVFIEFDHAEAGRTHSFAPELPLVFRW